MKDCKGMLITQNCVNVQMVMAIAFFGRNHMNETALRYKCIPCYCGIALCNACLYMGTYRIHKICSACSETEHLNI